MAPPKKENAFLYKRPFRKAPISFDWTQNKNGELFTIECIDDEMQLYEILKENYDKKVIAIDTETTSLDIAYAEIVGMSFAFTDKKGYYVPIQHRDSKNCKVSKLSKIWNNFLTEDKVILMYNESFDIPILEKLNLDFRNRKVFDVQNLTYLKDTNIHMPSLKECEEFFLGWIMPTYEETTNGKNFSELTSKEAYFYAGCDALGTLALFEKLLPDIKVECPHILTIDNKVVKVLTYLSRGDFHVRKEVLPSIIENFAQRKAVYERAFFDILGYPINIRSSKQLATALIKMGINTGKQTPKQAMCVSAAALAAVQNRFPVVKNVIEYNSLASIESGLKKYLEMPSIIHCKYQTCNTPHGRLSSGGDKSLKLPKGINPFYAPVNAQNFPNASTRYYKPVAAKSKWNIEGYNFEPIVDLKCHKGLKVEALNYEDGVRRMIHSPDPDFYFLNADYKGAELKLAANFSKEPNLIIPFSEGLDLHRYTAEQMFGAENYTKELRKKGKIMNFLALYQGREDAVQSNMNYTVSREECTEMLDKYWKTMSTLASWIRLEINKAKANPTIKTYYGRPRRLHFYLHHQFYSQRAFGERSVPSQIIAGTLGDIIRMKLIESYERIFNHPDFRDDVKFVMTVHDSIEFLIRKSRLQETVSLINDIMLHHEAEWALPLTVEYELGFSHGFALPLEFNEKSGLWELQFEE